MVFKVSAITILSVRMSSMFARPTRLVVSLGNTAEEQMTVVSQGAASQLSIFLKILSPGTMVRRINRKLLTIWDATSFLLQPRADMSVQNPGSLTK